MESTTEAVFYRCYNRSGYAEREPEIRPRVERERKLWIRAEQQCDRHDRNRRRQTFDTVFAGAGLQRPVSRSANLTFNYIADIQTSNTGTCPGPTCANFTTNQITIGLNWKGRPFVLH